MSRTPHWRNCDDEDCLVCRDRRERLEAKAREHALDRAFRRAQATDVQGTSLEEFTDA